MTGKASRVGLGSVAVLIVAVLMSSIAGAAVGAFGSTRIGAALDHPAVRLQAMVSAGSEAVPTSDIRVGSNVQAFADPQPQNEIAIAANPADARNLVIGSNDYRLRGSGGSVWVGLYTSTDGGRSFRAALMPGYPGGPRGALSTYQFGGDPIVGFDRAGRAYAGGIFFRGTPVGLDIRDVSIFVSRSDDRGITWNEPVLVALGQSQRTFHDHPQMAVDATGGPHDGNVYISWTRFTGVGQIDILVGTSRDRGATWSSLQVSGPIPKGDAEGFYQDSMVAVGPAGEVYALWDESFLDPGAFARTKIWMAVSLDGGRTFGEPRVVEGDVIPISLPNAGYRHDSYPVAAADVGGAHRGRLYLTWADQRSGNADILLKYSDDRGATWSSIRRVNDDAGTAAQFFQWVSVAPDGRVDIAFYDRRDDPADTLLNEYYAVSVDGGNTFTNVRVSDVSSDPAVWPAFIGDYNQIASTARTAHPAWSDFRNGLPGNLNQDAYTAAVTP